MTKVLTISGYCPTLNDDYSITVDYIDASDLSGRKHIKGLASCELAGRGDCPNVKTCPLIAKAPEKI